jgi:ribosomal-protein-alanine N-acetyltransferase
MTPAVYLQAATLDDVSVLAELERAGASHPWTPQGFAGAIRGQAGERVVVMRDDGGAVIGYCVWQEVADEAHVHNIGIAPAFRRQGLGRRLLAACLGVAARRGAGRAFLDVREGNEAARSLYRTMGFREVGRRPRYYAEPVEDAVVMEASLDASGILKSGKGAC